MKSELCAVSNNGLKQALCPWRWWWQRKYISIDLFAASSFTFYTASALLLILKVSYDLWGSDESITSLFTPFSSNAFHYNGAFQIVCCAEFSRRRFHPQACSVIISSRGRALHETSNESELELLTSDKVIITDRSYYSYHKCCVYLMYYAGYVNNPQRSPLRCWADTSLSAEFL